MISFFVCVVSICDLMVINTLRIIENSRLGIADDTVYHPIILQPWLTCNNQPQSGLTGLDSVLQRRAEALFVISEMINLIGFTGALSCCGKMSMVNKHVA